MAGSLNRVQLIGNLCRDPEVRTMQNGGVVCNISLATNEVWKDKTSGERREHVEFHRVVIFDDKLAEVCEKYLSKGSKVYLEGELRTRKWTDQSGHDKYTTEITLRKFAGKLVMLDSKSERQEVEPQPAPTGGLEDPLNDEVPF